MGGFNKLIALTFIFFFAEVSGVDARSVKSLAGGGEQDSLRRFCICVSADSAKVGDIFMEFKKDAQMIYDIDEDGLYTLPINDLQTCSISEDGFPLKTNVIPFPAANPEIIKLCICPKNSGAFKMRFDSIKTMPPHIKIMLIDKYLNCVVPVEQNKCYGFNVDRADFLSYGDKRFLLVIYQNQNYSFKPEAFGIGDNKKRVAGKSTPAQARYTINQQ